MKKITINGRPLQVDLKCLCREFDYEEYFQVFSEGQKTGIRYEVGRAINTVNFSGWHGPNGCEMTITKDHEHIFPVFVESPFDAVYVDGVLENIYNALKNDET